MKFKLPNHIEVDADDFQVQIAQMVAKSMGIPYTEHETGVKLFGADLVIRVSVEHDAEEVLQTVKDAKRYMHDTRPKLFDPFD